MEPELLNGKIKPELSLALIYGKQGEFCPAAQKYNRVVFILKSHSVETTVVLVVSQPVNVGASISFTNTMIFK